MARLRILATDAEQFPEWWSRSAVESAFDVVSGRPDATVLPMPVRSWDRADFEAATAAALDSDVPTAVYYRFDSWDDPARAWRGEPSWAEPLHRYCLAATVVAGPQLPITGGPTHPLPLPYPPLVAPLADPPGLEGSTTDLHFAGFFRAPGWAAPPADTRDRHHRGYLVERLTRELPEGRVHIRNIEYWGGDDDEQGRMRERYVAEIDQARLVLAPAGYGHLTIRHSDTWARGRVVLSEAVQRHVLVPEPQRWADGDIALLYDPGRDDIVEVVTNALRRPARLAEIAAAGWEYGRRWTRPEVQAGAVAEALASHLS